MKDLWMLVSHKEEGKRSVSRSYIFRHFTEAPQPPLVPDCKIRKLLPSWGNNRLPQCFLLRPQLPVKVETTTAG